MIVFDDMIAAMLSNKKLNPIVTELFIRGRELNISLVLIAVPKDIKLNLCTIIMKTPNKKELKQIASHISSDIDFMNLYKKCTSKSFSFLVDATLVSYNPLHFRKNLIERI